MQRRGFLRVLAGAVAALPFVARARAPEPFNAADWTVVEGPDEPALFGFAPGAVAVDLDPTRRYYLGVDLAAPPLERDFSAFTLWRTDPDGVMRVVEARSFAHEEIEDDPWLAYALDVGQYEGLVSLNAEQARKWLEYLDAHGKVVRYVYETPRAFWGSSS